MDSEPNIKGIFAAVPVLAAILAVSYDNGYFFSIGRAYYPLFSLTEHISFATEALPIALLISSVFLAALGAALSLESKSPLLGYPILGPIFALVFGVVGLSIGMVGYSNKVLLILFASTVVPILIAVWFLRQIATRLILPVGLILSILVAFEMGATTAQWDISGSGDRHKINFSDGTSEAGVLIREGDRGILFWNNSEIRFHFYRWDVIKSIDGLTAPSSLRRTS